MLGKSAVRLPRRSTETAILKVDHDIAEALKNKGMATLVLLDLSAAVVVTFIKILLIGLGYFYGMDHGQYT